ncbi:hypothetical protein [Mesorhizobium sp. KR9-304]|uniref:hypothetical protein n=1 Tax=Mesorhizobium sp. KR9-304 TaxID=3156614 RepID=UPI0032B44AAC
MDVKNASARVADIASRKSITPLDVLELRRLIFRDGVVAAAEAEALFGLDRACTERCAEWPEFLVEAITDYIVHQEKPAGYVSAKNAEWLIAAISHDGKVDTVTELELLVRVLEKAKFSTEKLVAFALKQVKLAVVDGQGPLMHGGELVPGVIEKAEVDLLRRMLHAFGGDGNIAITRAEAEVLFEINDAVADARNDASWNDLFVKAVANFVMCASGYQAPTREEALRQENFLDRADADIGGFLSRMASTGGREMLAAYRQSIDIDTDWEARNQWSDACQRRAERIDNVEARWLAERIGKDGRLQQNELALVRFIKQTSPSIHPELALLLEKVA